MAGPNTKPTPNGKFDWNQFEVASGKAPVAASPESSGGKFDWNQFQRADAPSVETSAIRGAIGGYTAGLDDEITGAVGAAGRLAGYKNLGSWKPFTPESKLESTDEPLSAHEIVQAYRDNRDAVRDDQKLDMATNPKATITANIAGAIVSPAAKIKAPKAFGTIPKIGPIGQEMATAALQGGLYSAGSSEADLTHGEFRQFAGDTALGAGIGLAIPPAIEGAKAVVKKGAQAVGATGRKLFSSTFGVTEDNASHYLANRAETNAAPELSEIKNWVDDSVHSLTQDVDNGKVSLEQAQDALKDLKQQVRNQLTDAKVDAREALRRSEDLFKESAAKLIQPLKDKRAPTQLANEVVNAVEDLKNQVSAKSGQAQEVLGKANAKVDLAPVYGRIDDTIEKLKGYGTDEADAVASKLGEYKSKLMTENWASIDGPAAKQRLQGLDQITQYNPLAGSYDNAKNAAFKGVRHELDDALKTQVPEYARAMEPVRQDSQLLSEVSGAFGDERKAIGRLGQVAGPKGALDREALAKLEQATGRNGAFTGPIDEYSRAQAILKNPAELEQMKRALPEYQEYRQAMAKLAKMKPEWTRDQLERALSTSKEGRAVAMAEDAFLKAKERLEPFKSLTPASTESKLNAVMRPGSATIETRKALEQLEQVSGKKILEPLKNRAVLDSFSKPYANGARNTLLWTVLGTAFGGLPGAGLGASYGQLIDRYGPKMGKAILDGIGIIRESPSVQTIRNLNLPPEVKGEIEREFKIYMISQHAASGANALKRVAGDETKTGPDKWADSGAKKLGIDDPALVSRLLQSKQGKQLLIEASDLTPGSRAMKQVSDKIQKGWITDESTTGTAPEVLRLERKPARGR